MPLLLLKFIHLRLDLFIDFICHFYLAFVPRFLLSVLSNDLLELPDLFFLLVQLQFGVLVRVLQLLNLKVRFPLQV